jgi:hypothetical protein
VRAWLVIAGAVAVGVIALVVVGFASTWRAEDWTAAAAWVTASVAVAAGATAAVQLREARRLRLEQSQPYVVVFMEASQADDSFIDLVIRNFGSTAATDVRVQIDPRPRRIATGEGKEEVWLPDRLPVLVPGQEWRTLFDSTHQRFETDLPQNHHATVRFKDSGQSREFVYDFELHWEPYFMRGHMVIYGVHHAAEALRKIEKTIKHWQEGRGLAVTVRDGDAKDAAARQRLADMRDPDAESD